MAHKFEWIGACGVKFSRQGKKHQVGLHEKVIESAEQGIAIFTGETVATRRVILIIDFNGEHIKPHELFSYELSPIRGAFNIKLDQ